MAIRKIEGRKIGKNGEHPEMSERKGDIVYPSFYIGIQHLPESKDWEIGKTYDVTLRVRQTGLNIRRNESSKKDFGSADFEIVGIESHGEVSPDKKRYDRARKKK